MFVYTLYATVRGESETLDIDVRDDFTEEAWQAKTEDEREKYLQEVFNTYAANLFDSGWHLKE